MDILSLPNEMLDAVVTATMHRYSPMQRPAMLKILRRVCRRFAYLYSIMNNLFHSVRFIADWEYFQSFSAEALAKSNIHSYVKEIVFVPPLHATMAFVDFAEIFKSQKEEEYGAYWRDTDQDIRLNRSQADIEQIRALAPPLPGMDEMLRGYQKYSACAARSLKLLASDEIVRKWPGLLRCFPRYSTFRFAAVDYNLVSLDFPPMMPECISDPTTRTEDDPMRCSERLAAGISDFFFPKVVVCMSLAGCTVTKLCLRQAMTDDTSLRWWGRLNWDGVNLSGVRELSIEPHMAQPAADEDIDLQTKRSLSEGVNALLRRCAPSLRELNCHHFFGEVAGDAVALPQLRSFVLISGQMSSSFLLEWLRGLRRVEDIYMHTSLRSRQADEDFEPEPIENWKLVFDAVRNQQSIRRGSIGAYYRHEPRDEAQWTVFDKDDVQLNWSSKGNPPDDAVELRRVLEDEFGDDDPGALLDALLGYYLGGQLEWFGVDKFQWHG